MGLSRVLLLHNRDQGDLSKVSHLSGCNMYVSTHVHTWVHLHACVRVGLGKLYGLRGSTEVKKGYRIDIVKWMCATRDWVCVRT